MLTVDGSVFEEWVSEHKSQSVALIVVVFILMGCWFILYKPLINYYVASQDIEKLKGSLAQTKKLILEREVLSYEKQREIDSLGKFYTNSRVERSSAVWLSHHLQQCGISQYAFSENNRFPPGGQGRPFFNVTMRVNYDEVLCVLSHFSRYGVSWNLSEMTLSRDNNKRCLTMKLAVEIQK